ncbi:MAG TPA: NAD(P)H-binding protein [Pedobacter sp.]|uniref:NmrA family NAD(P)-binding protein n=1 Tax=Pedobacter sp. TaxID=1411316 RepID=UPI002C6853B1|nr:NAD(P)H-binding protein [Pedobacter sp.]HMI01216.1 NAD(P)H-binding protein [Pedobacter sp.]
MKFTLTGSLGNTNKPLAEILIAAGHEVTIITSNADRVTEIEALGAKAAVGSIDDVAFLTAAFSGADAVYTMVPPNYTADDYRKYMAGIGQNFAAAIRASGVKQVVNLSSIGAHLSDGTGPIAGIHDVESIFSTLEDVAIKHVRAAFFYTNFYGNVDMIKHGGIIGANYGADDKLIMVHPADIAAALAEEIQKPISGKTVRYISSDERTLKEVAAALGTAIGKPDLPWVEFGDEQALHGMIEGHLPEEIAKKYVEMGTAIRSKKLWEDYEARDEHPAGKIKLEQFAKEFAAGF